MARRRVLDLELTSPWCGPLSRLGRDYAFFRKKRRLNFLVKGEEGLKLLYGYVNVTEWRGDKWWPGVVVFVGLDDGGVLMVSCLEEKAWLYAGSGWERVEIVDSG